MTGLRPPTRWYRHWHFLALRENLFRFARRHATGAVVAQCPLSARAALDVRSRLGAGFRIVLACHFPFSQAQEFRDKGELDDEAAYRRIIALEAEVMRRVDEVIYVSNWSRQVLEQAHAIRPRASRPRRSARCRSSSSSTSCSACSRNSMATRTRWSPGSSRCWPAGRPG